MTVGLVLGLLLIGFIAIHPAAERGRKEDYNRGATPRKGGE